MCFTKTLPKGVIIGDNELQLINGITILIEQMFLRQVCVMK